MSKLYRNLAHGASTLTRTLYGASGIWLLLLLCFSQCKKDDQSGPTNYHITVVDELTGESLANAKVILEERGGGDYDFDTLGSTNESGVFEYVFDRDPANHHYYFHSSRDDYYPNAVPLIIDHNTHHVTLGLVKKAILCFTATRVGTVNEIEFAFENNFDETVYHTFEFVQLGESRSLYQTVPSNRTTTVLWSIAPNPWAVGAPPWNELPVECGYGDTTFCAVDF